jgi:ribosome maturation factor RimP
MTREVLSRRLADLAGPLAQSMGLDLWGMEVLFASRSTVRVFVESGSGVGVDQCAELSRLLGLALDVEDLLPGAYTLEVSSPGLERKFFTPAQLAGARGLTVEVTLLSPLADFPGRRRFRGILESTPECCGPIPAEALFGLRAEDVARPGAEAPLVFFAFSQVKKAALVHRPPEKVLPGKGGKKHPAKKTATAVKREEDEEATEG